MHLPSASIWMKHTHLVAQNSMLLLHEQSPEYTEQPESKLVHVARQPQVLPRQEPQGPFKPTGRCSVDQG